MRDPPLYLLAVTVWAYWVCACIKITRVRRKERKAACFVPSEPLERLLWPVWFVLIVSWIALPTVAVFRGPHLLVDESMFRSPVFSAVRRGASLAAILCFAGTLECWARMGKSWRMAVTPGRKSELITTGLYSRIRHPIYALSILLMVCSAVILPSPPMVAVAALHITFMVLKARNEEKHLLQVHGETYSGYRGRTGRFFPKLSPANRSSSSPLSLFQEVMLIWEELHPYNAAHVLQLRGSGDAAKLRQALEEASRQAGVGTFVLDRKGRRYFYEPGGAIDLKEIQSDNGTRSLWDTIGEEMNRPFPGEPHHPFRWFFLPDPRTDSHFLLAVYHHVAADGAAACALLKRALGHYWGMPQPGDKAPVDISPVRAAPFQVGSLLRAIRQHLDLRHAHRPREREASGERTGFCFRPAPDGFLDRLTAACRRRQVSVNDGFLAALCASLAGATPQRREHQRRRALALGTIVDLRASFGKDASRHFGVCLGEAVTLVDDPDAELEDILSSIARKTRAAKAETWAFLPQWSLWALARLHGSPLRRWLPVKNRRRWYRKVYPLAGGVSNMRLERASFPGGGAQLLDYFRVVPTGPALPLALAPTTLDRQLSLSLTYRESSLSRSEAESLLEAIFSKLEQLSVAREALDLQC